MSAYVLAQTPSGAVLIQAARDREEYPLSGHLQPDSAAFARPPIRVPEGQRSKSACGQGVSVRYRPKADIGSAPRFRTDTIHSPNGRMELPYFGHSD